MKRTVGTVRMAMAGMVLMGGALGMIGVAKHAATNQAFPRIPRTEQEQVTRVRTDEAASPRKHGFSTVARNRGETDPCVPTEPIAFAVRGSVKC
jgi:hypothetical protein